MIYDIDARIKELSDSGVIIIDPRQTYIGPEVDLGRIRPGCELWPGTRLVGERTFIGSGAKIGTEGPVTIKNSVVGPKAEAAMGFMDGSTLFPRAKAGGNFHYRGGTLLEEEASTSHAVGLKQTILMYGVTLGSLINFCDALLSGGRSRQEHTEVGSGFIHFNFTPWGAKGDKATASLVGNVTEGVFLDKPQIFLGGMSGIVGPQSIGFGAMTAAGQVVRHRVENETMHSETISDFSQAFSHQTSRPSDRHIDKKLANNVEYLAQLYALKAWYEQVRLTRSRLAGDEELTLVYESGVETVESCIGERIKRWNSFAKEWGLGAFDASCLASPAPVFDGSVDWKPELEYDNWVWQLEAGEKSRLRRWLEACADSVRKGL